LRVGDIAWLSELSQTLWEHPKGETRARVVDDYVAAYTADPAFDGAITAFFLGERTFDEPYLAEAHVRLMACNYHLLTDQPHLAAADARIGVIATLSQSRLVACRAEALRRVGELDESMSLLDRPWHKGISAISMDAIKARLLYDMGREPEARALLTRWEAGDDIEMWASRWYVAHHDGAPEEELERLARMWQAAKGGFAGTLQQLMPQ